MLGRGLQYLFAPIGFNWQISIALVPGLAAREVAVGALGTVYAMSGAARRTSPARCSPMIAHSWSARDRAVAARLVRVRAAVPVDARRGEARDQFLALPALIMAAYLFALAYLGAFVTYRVALALGAGASRERCCVQALMCVAHRWRVSARLQHLATRARTAAALRMLEGRARAARDCRHAGLASGACEERAHGGEAAPAGCGS